jgi:hypothetical protein
MRRQRHPRPPAWPASRDHGQQHLHAEAVSAVWLKDLQAGVVTEFLADQGVRDLPAYVIVANAPGVWIAVGALPYLCRRPYTNPGEAAQCPISLIVRPRQRPL